MRTRSSSGPENLLNCHVSSCCFHRNAGIMGSVSSLIPGTKNCRGSDQKLKKGFQCKRGRLLKHEHNGKNNNSELGHISAGTGNTDDFFYIKVSHTPRGEETTDEAGSRRTPTELSVCTRLEQTAEGSFMAQFSRSSSSSVETHNSLSTILGTNLRNIDRPKAQTPEPKQNISSGSPCDSGIYGSSWTNDAANSRTKLTGGFNGDGRTSNSSMRSTSVLSDCTSGPTSLKTDTTTKTVELTHTSPSSERNFPSSLVSELSEEQQLYGSEVSQHALRAQQLLQLQVIQLQQDKDRLQEEVDQLIRDRDSAESQLIYKHQHTPITATLEETQWEVCQKVGEISLLKQQLKDSQAEVTSKLSDIVSLRAALRETRSKMEELVEKQRECEEALRLRNTEMEVCENELQRKKNEAELLREKAGKLETDVKTLNQDLLVAKEEHLELLKVKDQLQEQQNLLQVLQSKKVDRETSEDLDVLQKEVERLREQLEEEKRKKEKILSSFQHEKQTWNKEKDKVIRYQKQLQCNYLQMHRKNQELEKRLKERNGKVENRTEKDRDRTQQETDVRKTDVRYSEMVATEI
ncbi:leucine zipper putative tumor suppressor 1 isoform X1 [Tachysurus fulvidraco]|uniref:leucine zipper putative tumor suppressor 1 isoform X1 n=1 Tax=Tachysurus fulvidraco TaxID=1234273 RepID=UPI001FEDFA2E|nr:leucine zipper putative tumor suppressor 1 isoform X1 [Tachysurus fulvidraco]XP_047678795.1 leucine zipper putative tumor suppressor 1 isoform X1 [Tachysurus fulvidraco]